MKPPVIGDVWTDHPNLPHGTREQVLAWLRAAWNARVATVVRVTDEGVMSAEKSDHVILSNLKER